MRKFDDGLVLLVGLDFCRSLLLMSDSIGHSSGYNI